MKKTFTENQELRLKKLENELLELWETLNPAEKKRKLIFDQFLKLQGFIHTLQVRNKILIKENTDEQTSR